MIEYLNHLSKKTELVIQTDQKGQSWNTIWKMECDQPSGSFKIRGMEHLLSHHLSLGHTHFVCSSGGNAGYSLAYCAKMFHVNLKVVTPFALPEHMRKLIETQGAKLILKGKDWAEADAYARKIAHDEGSVYVSPFDDSLLWKGYESIIEECAEQMEEPEQIYLSVGGGGLLMGIWQGLKKVGWKKAQIVTIETPGTASFFYSNRVGSIYELDEVSGIATSLAARKVPSALAPLIGHNRIKSKIITDKSALHGCRYFFEKFNRIVEPACGAMVSAVRSEFGSEKSRLAIACGGITMNSEFFHKTIQTL